MTSRSFGWAIKTTLGILVVASLAACTSTTGGSASAGSPAVAPALEGTLWKLAEYVGPDGKSLPVPDAVSASATFVAGTVSGNAGCNDYSAAYTLDGAKMTIGPAVSTKLACGPAESLVETAYLATLGKVATYAIDGESLALSTTDGKVGLRYTAAKPASLVGTRWLATSVNNGTGGSVSIVADTSLTAVFADGTVAGSGGCNQFNGPYTSDATTIKIGPLMSSKKLCGDPAGIDDQEAQYLAALQKATTYTIKGNELELRDAGGALQVSYLPTLTR
jgi:heat shock protein HslJ